MPDSIDPTDVVREFFACYSEGRPDDFAKVVSPDYLDFGHTPPGRGPEGARDDYEQAVAKVGGNVKYVIDAAVADNDVVAAAWTGTTPDGASSGGLSLYRVVDGLITSTHHTRLAR